MVGGGRGEALAVGVKLGGVVEIDGVTEGVESAVGDEDTVGVKKGELVGLALPDGVTELGAGAVAEAVGLVVSEEVGLGLSAGVEVSAGVGVKLSAGEVSDRSGAEDGGVAMPDEIVGVSRGSSAEEARGKARNIKSPTSGRAPAGLNRGTFTPSS